MIRLNRSPVVSNRRQMSANGARRARMPRRGMALLLVMLGVIICSILTAGFLASQGTSIGIARNERDATKGRAIAQTGIDMCYWQIRNKPDWRQTMAVGTWLNAVPIGDGTVTVAVADGDSTGNFADNPTQPVKLTSTSTYDGRTFTLTANIRPTGGGTVFGNGNFVQGTITLGGDLLNAATIDSYNSGIAAYNSGSPGSNAVFGSNSLVNNALTIYFPSVFRGSYLAAPTALLGGVLNLIGLGALSPTSMSNATESRDPGKVVMPNVVELVYRNNFSKTSQTNAMLSQPGRYDSFFAQSSTILVTTSGIYHFTGNMTVNNIGSSSVTIQDGVTAVFVVNGNVSLSKPILINGSGRLALYCNGTVTIASSINANGKDTSRFALFGSENSSSIQFTGTNSVYGSIYAPQASMLMQTGKPQLFGAVVVKDLTMKNGSEMHFDEALRNLSISNVTGGSAPPGNAKYVITVTGGPGVVR